MLTRLLKGINTQLCRGWRREGFFLIVELVSLYLGSLRKSTLSG